MKRTIGTILFVIYAIIAITVTVLLLSFNEYNLSEIGGYTVYIAKDDSLEPEYKQGSILLIKSTSDKHIQVGDEMFVYKIKNSQEFDVVIRTLKSKTQQGRHIIYGVEEDDDAYSADYFIGKVDDIKVIEGWGTLLSILESKWGYLFCIVIISLLLFLQEVFELIIEIKYGGTKGTKAANVSNARKNAKKKTTTKAKTTTTKTDKTAATAKTSTAKAKATVAKETVEVEEDKTEVKDEG